MPVEHVFVGSGSDEVLATHLQSIFVQELPGLTQVLTYSLHPVYSQFFGISANTGILSAQRQL